MFGLMPRIFSCGFEEDDDGRREEKEKEKRKEKEKKEKRGGRRSRREGRQNPVRQEILCRIWLASPVIWYHT